MRRRQFLGGLAGATAWPLVARSQQPQRVRRIGVLMGSPENNPEVQARLGAFRQGLESLGWSSRNVQLDYRFAPSPNSQQVQVLAKELIALQPDVIVANTPISAAALNRETRTIPVVFTSVGDPVGLGLITNLARPNANLTGLTTYEASIAGKWVTMLKEIAPRLTRAAVVANPATTTYDYYLRAAETSAKALAIELVPISFDSAATIELKIESFAHTPDGGLFVLPDPMTTTHGDLIIALAARHKLPAVYWAKFFVSAGGLMSYGTDRVDELRQAASYVDRILRGDKPADLPVQTPTKFETALNLKTAKALGLAVPPGLIVAADEVIE